MMQWIEEKWLPFGLFGIAAFLVYGASLGNGFLLWDDAFLIEHNALLQSISLTTVYQAFTTFDPELYIPLTFLSYQIDWMLGGGSPFVFHLTSLLLHIINALLIMRIAAGITGSRESGIAAGLILLVHPLNTEAVVWASARKDLLSSMYFLAAFTTFLEYRRTEKRLWYVVSVSAFLLALLSKVTAMMLPLVLLLLEELRHRPRTIRRYAEYLPYFALAGFFGLIAVLGKQQVLSTIPLWTLPFLTVRGIGLTLLHAVAPFDLTILYPEDHPLDVLQPAMFGGALITVMLLGIIIAAWKRRPLVAFGMGMFLLCMVPTFATFAKAGYVNITSDRYAYLPLVGLMIAACAWMQPRMRQFNRQTAVAGIAVLAMLLGVLTQRQAATWSDSKTLFTHAIGIYPSAPVLLTNLGVMAMNERNFAEAEERFSAALAGGTYANAAINLGKLRQLQGKPDAAEREFRRAAEMDPRDPESAFALGSLLTDTGREEEAIAAFRDALIRNPLHGPSLNNLGALLLKNGRLEEAIAVFERLLENSPYYGDAWFNYGLALHTAGRSDEAADAMLLALRPQPANTDILEHAVEILIENNRSDDAVFALQKGLEASPGNAQNAQLSLQTAKAILAKSPDNAAATQLVRWMIQQGIVASR